jgi:hypothetical protein
MATIQDGPKSPHFRPLPLKGNTNFTKLASAEGKDLSSNLSVEMVAALEHAPTGACVFWGIPFNIDEVLLLTDHPISVQIDPLQTRWLVFLHTSDIRPLGPGPGGIISPMRGQGQLAEHAADYVIVYTDGSQARAAIRRRFQVGAFQRPWGENCFECVAQRKPHPVAAPFEKPHAVWGLGQMRVDTADSDPWGNWLWAWENPYPEKSITGFVFEPMSGVMILSAITAGNVASPPLRWRPRRKACLVLPEGESFLPELDEDGLLKQIQIDLGQVISATPRLVYPDESWPVTYNHQLPQKSGDEVLVEYTAHPEACFHLAGSAGSRVIPVSAVEDQTPDQRESSQILPVAPAERMVWLRVVERGSRKPVPVKLHLHGEWGEYLPPVDRHRIPDPAWFEDYSVEHVCGGTWANRGETPHDCTYIGGETRVKLPLGKVFIEISKGFEIRPLRKMVEVTPDTDEILVEIEKVLPWREKGWITADTHVHFLSPISARLEGAAEGVNVINLLASQWGELMTNVGDFDGQNTWGSREAGGNGEYLVRVGTENRQHILGHISLLGYQGAIIAPMTTGGPDESALGDPVETLLLEWARQCRAQAGLVVLPHFPNPRCEQAACILSGQVDAVEMTSWDNRYDGINPYSLSDWYRYLNCGYIVPAVGGTDKMTAAIAVGTVRTYAHIASGVEFTYESWKEAIRRGETFVTYGPLIEFQVDGHPMGSQIALSATGGTLDIDWQVATVTVPISRVELVVNGEIRESVAVSPDGGSGHWSLRADQSCWVALLVRGHYANKPEVIVAHSSPVMIRVEGSQLLAAADAVTILDQVEGAMAYLDTVSTRADDRAYKRMRLALESAHRSLHNRLHQQGYFHEHTPVNKHGG